MTGKEKETRRKLITKNLVTAGAILAICIISQFFKTTSVYITGPIINACLIIAALTVGYEYSVILSAILPITSFIITGSPIISAVPLIMPCIMAGNIILVSFVSGFTKAKKSNTRIIVGMGVGSVIKSIVMGASISYYILPTFLSEASPLYAKLSVFQFTFSFTQLITSVVGSILAFAIWIPVKKVWGREVPESI